MSPTVLGSSLPAWTVTSLKVSSQYKMFGGRRARFLFLLVGAAKGHQLRVLALVFRPFVAASRGRRVALAQQLGGDVQDEGAEAREGGAERS